MKPLCIFLLAIALCFVFDNADAAKKKKRMPVVLKRANTLQSFEENGVKRQELNGDVWITQDSISIMCQKAVYYPDSGKLYFRDKVEFFDSPRTLLADEVDYNEFTQELTANSNVRIYQDTLSISCQRAKYLSGLKQGYLFDDVKIKERGRNLMLTGQYGFFDHEINYARVTGDPILTERDSSFKDVTEVKGDTVEFFGNENRARVSRNVVIVREGLVATGDRVDYFTKEKYAELVGTPQALQNLDEINGDTMRMYFEGEKLKFVEVIGHAVAVSPADSGFPDPKNKLEGKQMRIWLNDQKIDSVLVEGNAIANYFIREKDKRKGKDETSGDKLLVFFEHKKISRIRVLGGTKGQYIPERLTNTNPKPN